MYCMALWYRCWCQERGAEILLGRGCWWDGEKSCCDGRCRARSLVGFKKDVLLLADVTLSRRILFLLSAILLGGRRTGRMPRC